MGNRMDERTLRALVDAGAVKRVSIVANGARFHVEIDTAGGSLSASTVKGEAKTWRTLDAAAKWVRSVGIGNAQLDLARWQPGQRVLSI